MVLEAACAVSAGVVLYSTGASCAEDAGAAPVSVFGAGVSSGVVAPMAAREGMGAGVGTTPTPGGGAASAAFAAPTEKLKAKALFAGVVANAADGRAWSTMCGAGDGVAIMPFFEAEARGTSTTH